MPTGTTNPAAMGYSGPYAAQIPSSRTKTLDDLRQEMDQMRENDTIWRLQSLETGLHEAWKRLVEIEQRAEQHGASTARYHVEKALETLQESFDHARETMERQMHEAMEQARANSQSAPPATIGPPIDWGTK